MENTKLIKKLIDYYLTGYNLTQEEHNAVTSLEKQLEAVNFAHSCEKLSDCVIHSTDWNGKCFNCGKQVFVREEKQ